MNMRIYLTIIFHLYAIPLSMSIRNNSRALRYKYEKNDAVFGVMKKPTGLVKLEVADEPVQGVIPTGGIIYIL